MECPCCNETADEKDVLSGDAGWKLVVDAHADGEGAIALVNEWQCSNCYPWAHDPAPELPKGHTWEREVEHGIRSMVVNTGLVDKILE